jgi:hypothetical protein
MGKNGRNKIREKGEKNKSSTHRVGKDMDK